MFSSESHSQVMVNGELVKDSGYTVDYDGKILNLGLQDLGEKPVNIEMSNKELDELLKITEPSKQTLSLGDRLIHDFGLNVTPLLIMKKGGKKKTKRRKSKRKKTRKK